MFVSVLVECSSGRCQVVTPNLADFPSATPPPTGSRPSRLEEFRTSSCHDDIGVVVEVVTRQAPDPLRYLTPDGIAAPLEVHLIGRPPMRHLGGDTAAARGEQRSGRLAASYSHPSSGRATLPLSVVCQPCRSCAWLVAHSSA